MSELNKCLKHVSVIGAGGKMGAGITLLLLTLMSEKRLIELGRVGDCHLKAIDVNEKALVGRKKYLKQQLTRYAEKNINQLRKDYAKNPHLVSNEEVIEEFTSEALECIDFSNRIEDAGDSLLIFEAAIENIEEKIAIFKQIKEINSDKAWILTNTSSIPISLLNDRANLQNRIVGFHFYNPPPIQKLVEIIELSTSPEQLKQLGKDLGQSLNKTLVYSHDIAGFIGNGYFMREILFTLHLLKTMGSTDLALLQIEWATRDFLLRPMGIFQLIDYVGLDVVKNILSIMKMALPDAHFVSPEIDQWLSLGVKGGQTFDGQQKDGIFKYEKGKPMALFSLSKKAYTPFETALDLGKLPVDLSWKNLSKEPKKDEIIDRYFEALIKENTLGAKIAIQYLKKGKEISDYLVASHVASSLADVTTVLKNGFYHLYGPRGCHEKF